MLLRKIPTVAAAMFLIAAFSHSAFAASFDCAKARSRQEKLICSTPALSKADEPMTVSGAYMGLTGNVEIRQIGDNKAIFSMVVFTVRNQGTSHETANTGDITDEGVLQSNTVRYDKKVEGDEPCKLQISLSATKAVVEQEGTCDFGMNVWATGVYFRISNEVPDISIGH